MSNLTDQNISLNPCIKTGCLALIAGRIWRGDLFDLGQYLMLNCSAGPQFENEFAQTEMLIHLEADTWQSAHQQDRVVILNANSVSFFSYEGVPTLLGLVQVV